MMASMKSRQNHAVLLSLLVFLGCVTVLVVGGAIGPSRQQDSFYFDPAPVDQDAVEGQEIRLRCDVSNRDRIAFYWAVNMRPVANTSRRYQDGSDLLILSVDRTHDSGGFRCVATNVSTGIALRSNEARLNILWISKLAEVQLKQPADVEELVEGGEASIVCQADGNPEPSVLWWRNKVRILPNSRIKFAKNRLVISSVNVSDNGVYSCRANNLAGHVDSLGGLVLNVPGRGVPRLVSENFLSSTVVRRGSQTTLNCQFRGAVRTEWYFNQTLVVNSRPKHTLSPNGSLTINNIGTRDAGIYRCVGFSAESDLNQTYVTELLLAYLEDMSDSTFEPRPSTPQVIPVGGRVSFKCRAPKGLPESTIRWTNPYDVVITAGDSRDSIRDVNGTLTIQNAADSDAGNYTCRAENMDGVRSRTIMIVVSVPPKISRPPLSVHVTEGETAMFDCVVTGTRYPATVISWTFNESPLDLENQRYLASPDVGRLTINSTQLSDDGNYACAVHTTGYPVLVSSSAHLYVYKQLKFKPVPVNTKLELGSPGRIACRADGRTTPTVRWVKVRSDGQQLHQALPDHVTQSDDGSLSFRTVESGDAGNYTCFAENEQGTISATIRVDIVVKPRFKVKPINATVAEGSPMMLHCVAIGDPSPTVHWDKNNRVDALDLQRFTVMKNGSLHVAQVYAEDAGKYGCTAGNTGGFVREEVQLSIAPGGTVADPTDGTNNVTTTIVIAVCSVVAYLAIVVGLTVYCSLRLIRRRNIRKRALQSSTAQPPPAGALQASALYGPPRALIRTGNTMMDENHLTAATEATELMRCDLSTIKHEPDARSASSSNHSNTSQLYEKIAMPRSQLQTLGVLGKGQFGEVFVARAFDADSSVPECLVMVKSLLFVEEPNHAEFYRQVDLFHRCNHINVVRLFGISREAYPTFAIYEYCDWGSLKQFLQAVNGTAATGSNYSPSKSSALSVSQRVAMCRQVSHGMKHIAFDQRLIHGDLAARNLVVTSSLVVKISGASIHHPIAAAGGNGGAVSSSAPASSEYFLRPGSRRPIPLRWTAPELIVAVAPSQQLSSIQTANASKAGDVWAFGVVLWELFAAGCPLPLADRNDQQVLAGLEALASTSRVTGGGSAGTWLRRPHNCPEFVWSMADRCLDPIAVRRPTFVDVADEFDNFNPLDDSRV